MIKLVKSTKSKFFILFLVSILLSSSSVIAQNCDYYEYENYTEEDTRFYLGEELLDGKLEILDTSISGNNVDFKIFNPFDFEVEVKVDYMLLSSWFGNRPVTISEIIPPREINILRGRYHDDTRSRLGEVKLSITEPTELDKRLERVTKQREICKNCTTNEIFCEKDKKCVSKDVVPLNVEPECGLYQECVSQYINPETGLCEKSPAQIQKEENQRLKDEHQMLMDELHQKEEERKFLIFSIIAAIGIIILGGISIYFLKYRNEKEKQNTLQKEIELEAKKIQAKEFELNKLRKQIAQIKEHKELEQIEIEELNHLKARRNELIQDIQKQYHNITEPFPDSQASNRLVIINPYLGGYKCFYKEKTKLKDYPISSLVHRWVWKKENGRNPKPGYHIHHIDGDKYNNDPRNLEEMQGEKHYEKHRQFRTDF